MCWRGIKKTDKKKCLFVGHIWVKALHDSIPVKLNAKVYTAERPLTVWLFEMESNLQPTFALITSAGICYPSASLSFGPE